MHYGHKKQLKKEQLTIVVYKHGIYRKRNVFDCQITSIPICKYVSPNVLIFLFKNTNEVFKKIFHKLKEERYYEVSISSRGGRGGYGYILVKNKKNFNLKIGKPKDVTNSKNELKHLH